MHVHVRNNPDGLRRGVRELGGFIDYDLMSSRGRAKQRYGQTQRVSIAINSERNTKYHSLL